MRALLELADAVERWHELQRPRDIRLEVAPGVELERRWMPLRSVGIYVPRGLVSTLVMCAVPAQAAGVERIVIVTPPEGSGRVARRRERSASGRSGRSAARRRSRRSRTDRVDSARRQDLRARRWYVNEAKLLVARDVAIDLPAGPSEVVVLAGADAEPRVVELELAAQAEHGPESVCRVVDVNGDLEAALVTSRSWHRSTSCSSATRPKRQLRGSGMPERSSSARGRRSRPATTRPAGITSSRPGGWARAVGGLGLETFLKPITMQRLTAEGLAARCGRRSRRSRRRRACPRTPRRCAGEDALPPSSPPTRGRRRRPSSPPRSGSTPSRSCASTGTSRPPPPRPRARARSPPRSRARTSTRTAATRNCRRDRPVRGCRAGERRPRRGRRRPHPALRADVRRPGRHGRDRGDADVPALPDRGAARRRRGRRRRARADVLLPPEQPDRRARRRCPPRGRSSWTRRTSSTRARRPRELIDDGVIVLRTFSKAFGLAGRASATRSPRRRPRPS